VSSIINIDIENVISTSDVTLVTIDVTPCDTPCHISTACFADVEGTVPVDVTM
jgi:hypothetical protein